MLANGKTRITEEIGAAIATLAAMQAGVAAIPARAPMTFDPVSERIRETMNTPHPATYTDALLPIFAELC